MDIQQLLDLRKITQATSRKFEADLKAHLATLAPLFSPQTLFGEHVRGGGKTTGIRGDKAYRELCARFKSVAEQKPFSLDTVLSSPLDLFAATPALTPVEYAHTARSEGTEHRITVTCPLKWTLSYPEATPKRLKELTTGDRSQLEEELRHALLQSVAMTVILDQQPGLAELFRDLRFDLRMETLDGLGSLPIPTLSAPLEARLPEDAIIIQNTQLTGIPSFEEIIDREDIQQLSDPVREALITIAQGVGQRVQPDPVG